MIKINDIEKLKEELKAEIRAEILEEVKANSKKAIPAFEKIKKK